MPPPPVTGAAVHDVDGCVGFAGACVGFVVAFVVAFVQVDLVVLVDALFRAPELALDRALVFALDRVVVCRVVAAVVVGAGPSETTI